MSQDRVKFVVELDRQTALDLQRLAQEEQRSRRNFASITIQKAVRERMAERTRQNERPGREAR